MERNTPLIKDRFSPSEKVLSPAGVEPAQQQFKKDADLNSIMAKFQKTGAMDHVKIYESEYGFASPTDYHASMNTIVKAEAMFSALPSSLRNRFENKPAAFLEFIQNDENRQEAIELGLITTPQGAVTPPEPSGTAKTDEAVGVGGSDPTTPSEDPSGPTP